MRKFKLTLPRHLRAILFLWLALLPIFIGSPAAALSNGIAKVEFYRGTTLLGTDTSAPYSWALTNVAAGSYSYTAKAYDTLNAVTTSTAVNVTINAASVRTETVTYYHNDALGSPIAATNAAGALLWRETYRPYGERLNNAPGAVTNPLWYTGKRQDPETGLVYMGARYYNPMLGRFLSIDPIEPDENNLHSLNRYAYANNNPYKFTDPDGQAAETVLDVVSLGLSINTYRQDPGFINGLAVAYDGLATAIPFLPGGIGIIRQAATKGSEVTQAVKQAADRGAAKAGEGAQKGNQYVDLASTQRRKHILDGDATGGGHRPGTGKPGKSEFPKNWSDDKIMHEISDVATDPNSVVRPTRGGRSISEGTRNGVRIRVIQDRNGDIVSGYPINVQRNPK